MKIHFYKTIGRDVLPERDEILFLTLVFEKKDEFTKFSRVLNILKEDEQGARLSAIGYQRVKSDYLLQLACFSKEEKILIKDSGCNFLFYKEEN